MKVIRFTASWHETDNAGNSRPKYEAGRCYPVNEETKHMIARGIAEEIDAPDDAEKAAAAADKAQAIASKAAEAAAEARATASVAQDAERIKSGAA